VVLSCGGVNVISTLEDLSMFHFSTYRLNITNITFLAGPKCNMSVCFPLNNSLYMYMYIYVYVYIWILSFLRLLSVFVKYYRFMGIREERMGEKVTKT
jgi:ABC-type transport system involved in Fe-S cluster assembly fused permease/ATPase subunit